MKGRSREKKEGMRRTGSFPSSSSSSSDFEFTVSLSPSSRRSSNHLCPADELFYKGQLLPLHLSPRISMVRTLLLASSSTSSSSTDTTTTTASRDSNGSSSSSASSAAADLLLLLPECDSSRPSSVTEEEARRATFPSSSAAKRGKYFSSLANRFSSVFLNRGGSKKDASGAPAAMELDYQVPAPLPTGKRANTTAKQVIKKYVKKVKPLYEKFSSSSQKNQNQSQSQNQNQKKKTFSFSIRRERDTTLMSNCSVVESMKKLDEGEELEDHGASSSNIRGIFAQSHSFSGNLRYPRRKRCAGSCPSSMRSSPTHSGLLRVNGSRPGVDSPSLVSSSSSSSSSSSMEELQNAIQGAIAHCKSTISQSSLKNPPSTGATASNDHDRLDLCSRSLNVSSAH